MFNGFKRQRGSWSAMRATLGHANPQEYCTSEVELICQSIDSFDDIRVLNDPTFEVADNNDGDVLCGNEEITSSELAILSTSSSASILSLDQTAGVAHELYPISSSNSQKIDEWCMKNDLTCNTVFPGDGLIWKKDAGDNFTYPILRRLSRNQILAVREFSRELVVLLRRARRNVQDNKPPHKYADIPSVFYVRTPPHSDLCRCSQDSKIFESNSWLGWTMVPGFTESHAGPYR